MGHSRVGNYHIKGQNSAKIKLMQDLMSVLIDLMSVPVICKFDKDPIKNEIAIIRTTFNLLYF